jgi:hypothetical protein
MQIPPFRLRSELKAWLDYRPGTWQVAMVQGSRSRQPSAFRPHVVGHPVIYLSLSGEEHRGFVIESNLFSFFLVVGFPFARGLCPFFGGAFTGEVP